MAQYLLDLGVVTKVVAAATGTGVTKSDTFAPPIPSGHYNGNVTFQALKTGAFTALTFGVEVTEDGGTTWAELTTWDAQANPAKTVALSGGILHRLNVKTFTGGTSVDVYAVAG